MEKVASNVSGINGATLPRRFGHRRSSSLPVPPANNETKLRKGKENVDQQNGKEDEGDCIDLSGLVDTFNQISESLSRPAKILLEILDQKNGNVKKNNNEQTVHDSRDGLCQGLEDKVETALRQLTSIQGNLKHVLPHMETMLKDYKTMKERTQSRDEMLKTLDTALRRSEGRSRALRDELQDMRDENKCLREKAQQNERILRFLNTDKATTDSGAGDKRIKHDKGTSVGSINGLDQVNGKDSGESLHSIDGRNNKDLSTKLEHYQKVLCDYETQLQEVVLLNKELVLKINERDSEVMNLNCELLKHQETLVVYEQGFKHLSTDNNKLDAVLRDERKRGAELSEKLDDAEGYISCITDKVASYEVELKYLRQELRKRDKKPT